MKIRSIPDLQGFIALRGRVIVDTYRGQVRIRSWPKKQTEAHKAKNANQIRWFKAAREMAKWAAPHEIAATKRAAKGTGLYPGDLQMMAAAGNLIPVIHGEPQNYEKHVSRLDPVSFQGIRANLASSQVWGTGAPVIAIWGVPEFQTTVFWTAGDPTHFVIPAGITKVALTLCIRFTGGNPTALFASIQENDTTARNLKFGNDGGSSRMSCFTGPISVSEGDTFRARCNTNIAGTMLKEQEVFFALEVLETTE